VWHCTLLLSNRISGRSRPSATAGAAAARRGEVSGGATTAERGEVAGGAEEP
jgi:hypothetical protein